MAEVAAAVLAYALEAYGATTCTRSPAARGFGAADAFAVTAAFSFAQRALST